MVNIKKVALWGFLILLVDTVVGLVLFSLIGNNSSNIVIGLALGAIIAAAFAYKSAKSIIEGLLEGVVAAALAMILAVFLQGGQNNYLILLVFIAGGLIGGFLGSQKK